MFTSSTKTQIFSIGLAPNNVLPFLMSLLYIASWTSFAFVWAEKFKNIVDTPFLSFKDSSKLLTNTDFPTPDYPVKITGFSISIISSIMYEYLIVSIVGTWRSRSCTSLSKTNYGILVDQFIKLCWVSGLIRWSKTHYERGNVKSLKVSSIADWIYALLTLETPPPKPQITAYMKWVVKTLVASYSTSSFIWDFMLCKILQIFVAHCIIVEGKGSYTLWAFFLNTFSKCLVNIPYKNYLWKGRKSLF